MEGWTFYSGLFSNVMYCCKFPLSINLLLSTHVDILKFHYNLFKVCYVFFPLYLALSFKLGILLKCVAYFLICGGSLLTCYDLVQSTLLKEHGLHYFKSLKFVDYFVNLHGKY